jgi:hypothetical protein
MRSRKFFVARLFPAFSGLDKPGREAYNVEDSRLAAARKNGEYLWLKRKK